MEPTYKIVLLVVFLVIRHLVLSAEVLRNVALGNTVTLSTTLPGYNQNNPSSAVDGKIAKNIDDCGCCVSSQNEPNPWLTVDLQEQYVVQKVVVIGRSDYQKKYISRNLTHLQMYNGNHTATVQIGLQIEKDNNTATARNLDQPFIRRITLKRPKPVNTSGEWFLTVCEIEIYVIECPSSTYGNNGACKACGHCSGGRPCDGMTGQCPEGCDPGYIGGTCTQECTSGTYGDCIQRCGQCKAVTCDKVNGRCPTGCNLGYMGNKCDQDCAIGYYGNCSQSCGNCTDGQLCDNVDGSCPGGCSQGYKGDTCHEECTNGTYGDCNQRCGQCKAGTCDKVNGRCPTGCTLGYMGERCDQECVDGTYGNCNQTCGHCKDESPCDKITGNCPDECISGYMGVTCQDCTFGYYGNCSQICGNCTDGQLCDNVDGSCPGGCSQGYKGHTCHEGCDPGQYGFNCSQTCGHCWQDQPCNHVTGYCLKSCKPGYRGGRCHEECLAGTYGQNCSQYCGQCFENGTCHHTNGTCILGCLGDFVGDLCQATADKQRSHMAILAASVSVCSVAVAVAVIVTVMRIKRISISSRKKTLGDKDGLTVDNEYSQQEVIIGQEEKINRSRHDTSISQQDIHAFTTPTQPDYYIFDSVEDNPNSVYIRDLWGYIMTCKANQCKLFFEQFKTLPTKLQFEHETAHLPENIRKNRYREVVTYDHSRVVLQVTSADQTDYINASFVDGYEREKKFIASQGPTPVMINDFWRMIWQQNTTKIVMLTNLVEMGKDKCERYWPETEGVEVEYGEVTVRLEKQDIRLDFCVRTLTVQQSQSAARHVTQYHFNSWPDKNVPDSAWCLVNFWRTVTEQHDGNQPIVVHCSAGVGRTGTFIALDALYEEARAEGGIRPLEMLETLRQHRVKLVQTKEQYVFLHEALAEALLLGPHPYWPRELPEVLSYLQRSDHGASKTRLQVQYQSLCLTVEGLEKTSEPEYGNVKTSEISEDADHSPMTAKPLVGDLKLTNFNDSLAYIVTLTPNKKSLANFWTKIQQYGVKTIINVSGNPRRTSNLGADGGKVKLKKYNVKLLHEKAQTCFIVRTYTFKEVDRDDNALSAVKQFEITAWRTGKWIPDDGQLLPMLVDEIIQWQPQITESQPLLITCSMDWSKCGLLVAVLNEAFRMRYRDCRVNILDTVIGLKRTEGRFISYEQFEYLYDAVISCINSSVKAEASDIYSNI